MPSNDPPNSLVDVARAVVSDGATYDGRRLRALYDHVVSLFQVLHAMPCQIGVHGAGFAHRNYVDFERVRQRVEAADFEAIQSISFRYPKLGDEHTGEEWYIYAGVMRTPSADTWESELIVYPNRFVLKPLAVFEPREAATRCAEFLRAFADLAVTNLGYEFEMERRGGPIWYIGGSSYMYCQRGGDEARNDLFWTSPERRAHRLLRDVYPVHYLTRPYLDLPIEGTTLERWILADKDRGILAPLNERVTVWTLNLRTRDQLREPMFRAGLLHCWRFFDPTQPLFRDFSKPFVPPDVTPDMFTRVYHAGRYPRLTY